jgi:hypothetical protein
LTDDALVGGSSWEASAAVVVEALEGAGTEVTRVVRALSTVVALQSAIRVTGAPRAQVRAPYMCQGWSEWRLLGAAAERMYVLDDAVFVCTKRRSSRPG